MPVIRTGMKYYAGIKATRFYGYNPDQFFMSPNYDADCLVKCLNEDILYDMKAGMK